MAVNITPIDGNDIPSDTTPNSEGATLNKDGTPRKRRGRPAGSGTGTRKTAAQKADVETALATMSTLYDGLAVALTVLRHPVTAEQIVQGADQAQAANRKAFEASPKLASAIARVGSVSSVGLFFTANVMLIGSALVTYRLESANQRAQAEQAQQQRPDGPGY